MNLFRYKNFINESKHKIKYIIVHEKDNIFPDVIELIAKNFSHVMDYDDIKNHLKKEHKFDELFAYIAMIDDELIGAYLLTEKSMVDHLENHEYDKKTEGPYDIKIDIEPYRHKKGLEGSALIVKSEYQNHGIGKELIKRALDLKYDYMWGQQLKSLKNLEDWLKRRVLVAENIECYITATKLK